MNHSIHTGPGQKFGCVVSCASVLKNSLKLSTPSPSNYFSILGCQIFTPSSFWSFLKTRHPWSLSLLIHRPPKGCHFIHKREAKNLLHCYGLASPSGLMAFCMSELLSIGSSAICSLGQKSWCSVLAEKKAPLVSQIWPLLSLVSSENVGSYLCCVLCSTDHVINAQQVINNSELWPERCLWKYSS